MTQDIFNAMAALTNSPMVFALMGLDSDILGGLLPSPDVVGSVLGQGYEICMYANMAAQAGRILFDRDTEAIGRFASLASSSVAGHFRHALAGKAAAAALVGITGSWVIVLAPIAISFAGRVAAKNLLRRARFQLFCRGEMADLKHAISLHCLASRDALQANIDTANAKSLSFRDLHNTTSGSAQKAAADWLNRLQQIQDFRRLNVDRLHRASSQPDILDAHGGDLVVAAQESLLTCARIGLHPANVSNTCDDVVKASTALQRRMRMAII